METCNNLQAFYIRVYVLDLLKRTYPYCELVYDYFDIPYDYFISDNKIHYRTLKRRGLPPEDDGFFWFKLIQIFDYLYKHIGFVYGIKKPVISLDELQTFERASFEVKYLNELTIIGNTRAREECENYDHVHHLLFLKDPLEFFEMYFYEYVRHYEKIRNKNDGYQPLLTLYILMKLKIVPSIHQNLRTLIITKNEHSLFKKISKISILMKGLDCIQ